MQSRNFYTGHVVSQIVYISPKVNIERVKSKIKLLNRILTPDFFTNSITPPRIVGWQFWKVIFWKRRPCGASIRPLRGRCCAPRKIFRLHSIIGTSYCVQGFKLLVGQSTVGLVIICLMKKTASKTDYYLSRYSK